MRSIATVSLGGTLPQKLHAIAAAGFDGVEIFEPDLKYARQTPEDIGQLARELGLKIVALQPWADALGAPDFDCEQMARLDQQMALMALLDTDLLLMGTNTRKDALTDMAENARQLEKATERLHTRGYRLGLEALCWGHLPTCAQAWSLVQQVDHPALGIVIDSFHMLGAEESLDTLAAIPGERIALVQLADAEARGQRALIDWSRHGRRFPGDGVILSDPLVETLARTGYQGPRSLEIFSDDYNQHAPEEIAARGYRSLDWIDALWQKA